jgi:hypothetical protein
VTGGTPAKHEIDAASLLDHSYVGKIYNDTIALSMTGFPAPVFKVISGELPKGLKLDSITGRITGVLTTAGNYTFTVRAENAGNSQLGDEKSFTIQVEKIVAPVFASNQKVIDTAYVKIPYEWKLECSGTPSPKFKVINGTLPGGAGMILSEDGRIQGTPAQDEVLTFTVRAESEGTYAYKDFTLCVLLAPVEPIFPSFEIDNLVPNVIPAGKWYESKSIVVHGSMPMEVFCNDPGSLPAGLSFDPTTLKVSGTPLAAGTGVLKLTAKNDNGKKSLSKDYPLTVIAPNLPNFGPTPSLPGATQGFAYTTTITVENATSVALVSATALPPGITVKGSTSGAAGKQTLTLAGKPTAAGSYTVQAKATNLEGSSTQSYTITVALPLLPAIDMPIELQPGTVGMAYITAPLTATHSPINWTWTGKMPPGLALITTATGNGLLTGTPSEAGTYELSFKAVNGVGESIARTASVTISPQTVPVTSLTSRELPVGSSAQIRVGMGLPPTQADSVAIEITGAAVGSDTLYLLTAGTFTLNANRMGTSVVAVRYYAGGTLMPSAGKSYTIEVYGNPTPVTVVRKVFVPDVEDAILSVAPGQREVLSGKDFTFTIRPTGERAGKAPVVKTDRQMSDGMKDVEVTQDATDRGLYHVRVMQVHSPVTLTITFGDESSNLLIRGTKVWGGKETLHILPVLRGEAVIYGSAGERVAATPIEAGQEAIVPLPAGVYVVVLDGGASFKAIVSSK